jgi:hypothetical protein
MLGGGCWRLKACHGASREIEEIRKAAEGSEDATRRAQLCVVSKMDEQS